MSEDPQLVRLGEQDHEVTLRVNGDEKTVQNVDDDTIIDVEEQQNVTVQIDGNQKLTEEITNDLEVDISTSAEQQSEEHDIEAWFFTSNNSFDPTTLPFMAYGTIEFLENGGLGTHNGYLEVYFNGDEVGNFGSLDFEPGDTLSILPAGGGDRDWNGGPGFKYGITWDYPVEAKTSVNNITVSGEGRSRYLASLKTSRRPLTPHGCFSAFNGGVCS